MLSALITIRLELNTELYDDELGLIKEELKAEFENVIHDMDVKLKRINVEVK